MRPNNAADYIIVGGGTAGCVVASRLKEAFPERTVCLLEVGPDEHQNPAIQTPLACFTLHGTVHHYDYQTVPQKGLNGRSIYNADGKCLSGSSAVNYGLWTRGDAHDYDEWANTVQDSRWSYSAMLPYFRKTESHYTIEDGAQGPDRNQHGDNGPIRISTEAVDSCHDPCRQYSLRDATRAAWADIGAKYVPDANNGHPHGFAPMAENWYKAKRQPAGTAYGTTGVDVHTNACVQRILFSSSDTGGPPKATGVLLADNRTFHATREVIICSGAIKTPQVLLLSGIGPATELRKHNILQVADLLVGQTLHDHVTFTQWLKLRHPEAGLAVGPEKFHARPGSNGGLPCDWLLTGSVPTQPLREAPAMDAGVEAEQISDEHPYLKGRGHYEGLFVYTPASGPFAEMGDKLPVDGSHVTAAAVMLLPTSRRSVTLADGDTSSDPVIDPNYFSNEIDRTMLRHAIRRVLSAAATPSISSMVESETTPDPDEHSKYPPLTPSSSDADIDARARRVCSSWWHPAGTAAMGSVVDTECRVKGVAGLRVVDASIFPGPIAAHHQAAVYAVAERAAGMIVEGTK